MKWKLREAQRALGSPVRTFKSSSIAFSWLNIDFVLAYSASLQLVLPLINKKQ